MPTWGDLTWRRISSATLLLGLLLAMSAALKKSVTVDEFQAVPSGLAVWRTGDFRYPLGTPPLSQLLAAAPAWLSGMKVPALEGPTANWAVAHAFADQSPRDFHRAFLLARLVSLAMLLGAMLCARALAERLYGARAAALTVACLALNPTFLAHGALATPDIYLAFAMALFLLLLDRFGETPSVERAAALGASIGLACLMKFTGLLLFPVLLFIRPSRLTILAWATALLVIQAGYAFQGILPSAQSASLAWLPAWLPLPFPLQFLRAAEAQLHEAAYSAYLLGTFNDHGFFAYYLVGLFVKSPAGLLLITALALSSRLQPRERPVAVLSLFFFGFFSLARYKNLGVRYLLFLYPWLATLAARIDLARAWKKWVTGGALATMAAGALLAWPDYIAYFNLPSGGPGFGHHYLLDSNLDWGQDLTTLKDFMDARGITTISLAHFGHVDPALYGICFTLLNGRPQSQYVAISANFLFGRSYFVNGTQFYPETTRLYQAYQSVAPVAVLGNTLYVFDSETIPELSHGDIGRDPKGRPEK